LIDYGLAKKFVQKNGTHIPYKEGKSLIGTARYASINTHLGIEQSRRDDLESIGYMMIYLLKGELPWMGVVARNKNDKYQKIKMKKIDTSLETLCSNLPEQLLRYFEHI